MSNKNAAHKAQLERQLWASADTLRGQMNSSEFQNYVLGIIFYKYLSEQTERNVDNYLVNDDISFLDAWDNEEYAEAITTHLLGTIGFVIKPEHLYSSLLTEINKGTKGNWSVDLLQTCFNSLEASTIGTKSHTNFEGLFSDVNLTSPSLGKDIKVRNEIMGDVLIKIGQIDFHLESTEIDILGDAYEYMIGKFASSAGKKGGEFYTPQSVSTILARIVTSDDKQATSFYDPTCGSGSLLLRAYREVAKSSPKEAGKLKIYGQEMNTTTYNLARMNMILHRVDFANFDIENGNTLTEDMFMGHTFDAIVANPPYSAEWKPTEQTLQDERYTPYGKTAPASKADYAFIQHIIHHLSDTGTAAVVLPHGVLFRGGSEGYIRERILKNNHLDAVIGLPANIFYGTTIPTCILIFRKDREEDDKILFIDASQEFTKAKNQNIITKENVQKIVDTFENKEEIDKYSALVMLEDIKGNDYNINIPRYVDVNALEKIVNIEDISVQLSNLNLKINTFQVLIEDTISELENNG